MNATKETIFAASHRSLGARMVDFAGWQMPVQYRGILEEHRAVREKAGVFDISHMGEIFVSGKGALAWLEGLLTNRLASIPVSGGQYTLLLNEEGGIIDDLIVYRLETESYLLLVNAAKIEEDSNWLNRHLEGVGEVECENRSDEFSALALQGPETPEIFFQLFGSPLPPKNTIQPIRLEKAEGWAASTGYTGELGFELFLKIGNVEEADKILLRIQQLGVTPCGLGARDTLRLEMAYPLNGSDLSPDHTPLEAGLGFFVCLDKDSFIGREPLLQQKEAGLQRRLAALSVEGKAPPLRPHYPVLAEGKQVAETTSGALSPSLGHGIAMAYLPIEHAKIGTPLEISVRGNHFPARVVSKPFYRKSES